MRTTRRFDSASGLRKTDLDARGSKQPHIPLASLGPERPEVFLRPHTASSRNTASASTRSRTGKPSTTTFGKHERCLWRRGTIEPRATHGPVALVTDHPVVSAGIGTALAVAHVARRALGFTMINMRNAADRTVPEVIKEQGEVAPPAARRNVADPHRRNHEHVSSM